MGNWWKDTTNTGGFSALPDDVQHLIIKDLENKLVQNGHHGGREYESVGSWTFEERLPFMNNLEKEYKKEWSKMTKDEKIKELKKWQSNKRNEVVQRWKTPLEKKLKLREEWPDMTN